VAALLDQQVALEEDRFQLHLPVADVVRLPARPEDAHKGRFGTVIVVGGAVGYGGAPYLAAMGAARGGAGRIRVCVPRSIYTAVAAKCVEVMAHPLPDDESGALAPEALPVLRERHFAAADTFVLGPGLAGSEPTERLLLALLEELPCPAVIDADGLNIAARAGFDWKQANAPVVITPHPGEMSRLSGLSTREVQAERRELARSYAAEQGVTVLLKGSETVIAAPDGRLHLHAHPVVALASGGSGDVLSGLVAALLAQRLDTYESAVAAVTIHTEAGAAVQAQRGRSGALPSDVLEELPMAQERVRRALEARGESR
jgi:NAD(P)H-hydrate epimerase